MAYEFQKVRYDETCQHTTKTADLTVNGLLMLIEDKIIITINGKYYQYHVNMVLKGTDESTKYFLQNGGVITIYDWWILHVEPINTEGCMGSVRNEYIIK